MRLTLRTMLAYLDDVLDPGDAHELEKKIAESSFASGLVHRIRDSMRRLRLGAPQISGKGMGLDPNSVAEYLDSTLDPEGVPEFEKVCLESDVHLAEVASCHQILTMVLAEPAHVEPALRNRIYRIGKDQPQRSATTGNGFPQHQDEAPSATPEGSDDLITTAAEPVQLATPKAVSVPASRTSAKTLILTLLLGFLIAFIVIQAVGIDRLRGWMGLGGQQVAVVSPPESEEETNRDLAEPLSEPEANMEIEVDVSESSALETEKSEDVNEGPQTTHEAAANPHLAADETPLPTSDGSDPTPEASESSDAASVTAAAESQGAEPVPIDPEPASTDVGSVEAAASPDAEVTAARRATPVGRYTSEEQVMARFDLDEESWYRLAPDTPLAPGDRLLALPTYRPQLMLAPGIKITLAGETHLTIGETRLEPLGPSLSISSGRCLIVPVGTPDPMAKQPIVVHLELRGRTGVVRLTDSHSILAVEVRPHLPPGSNPELDPAITVVELYALSGEVEWQEQDASYKIGAGTVLAMQGSEPAGLFVSEQAPNWIEINDLTDIDRLASAELRRHLATDRLLVLSLLEQTKSRKIDVRSLACRALCSLDLCEPSLEALSDNSHRSYWDAHFDALRRRAAASPEAAVKLQAAVQAVAGDDSEAMFRLLWGYSPEQLAAGNETDLVNALESDRMAVRVLAYENLRRITGKTHMFRPEERPALQERKVANWRRTQETEGIQYSVPPAPLPERSPVTTDDEPPSDSEADSA